MGSPATGIQPFQEPGRLQTRAWGTGGAAVIRPRTYQQPQSCRPLIDGEFHGCAAPGGWVHLVAVEPGLGVGSHLDARSHAPACCTLRGSNTNAQRIGMGAGLAAQATQSLRRPASPGRGLTCDAKPRLCRSCVSFTHADPHASPPPSPGCQIGEPASRLDVLAAPLACIPRGCTQVSRPFLHATSTCWPGAQDILGVCRL